MRAWTLGLAIFGVACGGSEGMPINTDAGVDTGDMTDTGVPMPDAGADAAMEAGPYGEPSNTYPAFMPWMGQLTNNGGALLTAPIVVTVTWDGDTSRGTFEGLGDGLGMSSYWPAAVGEYGIGAVTSGSQNHGHISTAPPAQFSDQSLRTFLSANIGTTLPAATSQTIYVVYLAKSTSLIYGNQNACQAGVGGYHSSYNFNNMQVAYAVLPRCGPDTSVTAAASHEIGEAVTDPHPNSGLFGFDDPYLAFELWQRSNVENGDACEFFPDSYYIEAQPFAYSVQRLWSNKQGPLGHSPCQPYTSTYYNVAPLDLQDVSVDFGAQGGGVIKTKGYKAKQGDTIKVPIGIYSDAATNGAIDVTVAESNPLVNPVTGRLNVSVDPMKTSGVNGEKTFVNVTVMMEGPLKAELFTVITTLNLNKHYYPILIASQ